MPESTPNLHGSAFLCLHCGAYAQQHWYSLQGNRLLVPSPDKLDPRLHTSECQACGGLAHWQLLPESTGQVARVVYPVKATAPPPHEDMPGDVRAVYEEARQVQPHSPRAAAALLRLALQVLLVPFVPGETNLNKAIQGAVDQGLATDVGQMAMDIVRVRGNDGIHPSEIQLDDDPTLLPALFALLNTVVDKVIGEPVRTRVLYDQLPEGKRKQIEERNKGV